MESNQLFKQPTIIDKEVVWGDATRHYHEALWFYLKVGLVGLLVIYHSVCGYYRKKLIGNAHYKSHKFWRFFNEMPTLILFAVVILVVVKPTF